MTRDYSGILEVLEPSFNRNNHNVNQSAMWLQVAELGKSCTDNIRLQDQVLHYFNGHLDASIEEISIKLSLTSTVCVCVCIQGTPPEI